MEPRRLPARLLSAAVLGAVATTVAACTGDLFNDTSWAERTCQESFTPHDDPCAVDDELGFFVSTSGDDDAAGTREAPFESLSKAVARAGAHATRRRVFACAETFDEAIEVPAGVALFGGLDCDEDWAYRGEPRTVVRAPASAIAITLQAGAAVTVVEDVHAVGGEGTASAPSSIALLATQVTARITRCELEAKDGADGEAGETPGKAAATGLPGDIGGYACIAVAPNAGGAEVSLSCDGVDTIGGRGGDGAIAQGGDGQPGSPRSAFGGHGGSGQPAGDDPWDCMTNGIGKDGAPGADGDTGKGGLKLGAISAKGYTGTPGAQGDVGKPGQGGGGGGGARLVAACDSKRPFEAGAGGGSGGTGGCGGKGGLGGAAGGSSIALASHDARLTVAGTKLVARTAGNGGNGAAGQSGAPGAQGGPGGLDFPPSPAACPGGHGGNGGRGGPGGGGRGGHSIGVAFAGTAPTLGKSSVDVAAAGDGGLNGAGGVVGAGAAGVFAEMLEFPL